MTDENPKTCPHCGKQLRRDNTRGACSSCLAAGKKSSSDDVLADAKPERRAKSDVIKRFKVVASALGKDPDEILEEAAEAWLALVSKAVGG